MEMIKNENIATYEPDNSLKKGYIQLLNEIVEEIVVNRWLTYQLFRRNFLGTYKQSLFGILWIIIIPVVNVSVFAVLNNSGIFNIGDIQAPYPIFALSAMAFWQIFASGLGSCGISLVSAGEMITRINFSKKSLVFAPLGRALVSFMIQLVLIGLLFLFYRIPPSIGIILIPLVMLPVIFLTLGLGFIIAAMNAIVRDIGNILPMGITFLMYLTPVLYVKPEVGILSHVTKFNPMYYFVASGRDLMLYGRIGELNGFIISAAFSVILFLAALVVFHLTETRIAERV
jgi:lipopolysaccharide transport system permease protein